METAGASFRSLRSSVSTSTTRRRSSVHQSKNKDQTEESYVHVKRRHTVSLCHEISKEKKVEVRTQLRLHYAVILFELLDFGSDLVGYSRFVETSSESTSSSLFYLFTIVILIVSVCNLHVMRMKWRTVKNLLQQLHVGIHQIAPTGVGNTKFASEPVTIDETNIHKEFEFNIQQSDLVIRDLKTFLIAAVLEDFLMLLLGCFRLFLHPELWGGLWVCFGSSINEVLCEEAKWNYMVVIIQAFFSATGLSFKMSYVRDLYAEYQMRRDLQLELEASQAKVSSVLDDFADVEDREIRKVVTVRHMLGDLVDQHPHDVLGDVNILRFLRQMRYDIYRTFQKIKEHLVWRKENGMDDIRAEILRNNWAISDLDGAAELHASYPYSFCEFQEDGCKLLDMFHNLRRSDLAALKRNVSPELLRKFLLSMNEWKYGLYLDKLSLDKKQVVVVNTFADFSSGTLSEFLKIPKLVAVLVECTTPFERGLSKSYMYGFSDIVRKSYNFVLKPLLPKEIEEKNVFLPKGAAAAQMLLVDGFTMDTIPKSMGGLRCTGAELDPDCLSGVVYAPISKYYGAFCELSLFNDVSHEEVAAVMVLKARLVDELAKYPDDVLSEIRLLRYLRELNMEVETTYQRVKKMLRWRDENELEAIRRDLLKRGVSFEKIPNFQVFDKVWPRNYWLGTDRSGNVVQLSMYVEKESVMDWKELTSNFTPDSLRLYHIYGQEIMLILLEKLSRKKKRVLSRVTISDWHNFALSHIPQVMKHKSYMNAWMAALDGGYSDLNCSNYIFGISRMLVNGWRQVSALLPENVTQRTTLLPYGEEGVNILLYHIPSHVLPVSLGGNKSIHGEHGKEDYRCLGVKAYSDIIDASLNTEW